jgi:Rha family phage regulatory protein
MSDTIPVRPEALISKNLKTTSLCVARCFDKRHDNVVRLIESLDIPAGYRALNFEETFREVKGPNKSSRLERYYTLSRDGFSLLVMGFTGKKAMEWKIRFLEAFTAMEAALREDGNGVDRLTALMDRMDPVSLKGFMRLLSEGGLPRDDGLDRLLAYLDTRLLDAGMSRPVRDELAHLRRVITALRVGGC